MTSLPRKNNRKTKRLKNVIEKEQIEKEIVNLIKRHADYSKSRPTIHRTPFS